MPIISRLSCYQGRKNVRWRKHRKQGLIVRAQVHLNTLDRGLREYDGGAGYTSTGERAAARYQSNFQLRTVLYYYFSRKNAPAEAFVVSISPWRVPTVEPIM